MEVSKKRLVQMGVAVLVLIVFMGVAAFALYVNKPWFAGIFGGTAILAVITTFVEAGKDSAKSKK